MHEFSVTSDAWSGLAGSDWMWALWGIAFLVLILIVGVNSISDHNLIARLWNAMHGTPGRDLFYKFPYEIVPGQGDGNVATLPGKPRTGYLRYIDLSRVRFFTNVSLAKGQIIHFNLNSLPGFLSEEPAELSCVVRSCAQVRPKEQRFYVDARIVRLEPTVRGVLNDFLEKLHPSQTAGSQRA